jgi:hypothetical protein
VEYVAPYWRWLPQEQRVAALTVDLATLRERAKQLSEKARAQAGGTAASSCCSVWLQAQQRNSRQVSLQDRFPWACSTRVKEMGTGAAGQQQQTRQEKGRSAAAALSAA